MLNVEDRDVTEIGESISVSITRGYLDLWDGYDTPRVRTHEELDRLVVYLQSVQKEIKTKEEGRR